MSATAQDAGLALLELLAGADGMPVHRATKRLGISLSELQRLLTALGRDPRFDGLDLVELREADGRQRLWLTDKGRALCGRT